MFSFPVMNLGAPIPSGQTVMVPVLKAPPVHSLVEETGSGLPVIPLVAAGIAVVAAVLFW